MRKVNPHHQTEAKPNPKSNFRTEFQTPPKVCEYMVNLIPEWCKTILEPTPGLGNIVRELKIKEKYDITTPADYFLLDPLQRFDCIVMNPPFGSNYAFMENAPQNIDINGMRLGYHLLTECMGKSDNVIALMPWFTISDSDLRLKALKEYGIKTLTALPRKTFQYARIQTVIIELEKGFKGDTLFKTLQFTHVIPGQMEIKLL